MMLDIFVLPTGRPFFDIIFANVPKWPTAGKEVFAGNFSTCAGGSFNIAYAMHKLGLDVGFCAHLGNDFFSNTIRDAMKKVGMSTKHLINYDESKMAVTVSISLIEDRGFVSYVEPIPDFDEKHLPEHGVPNVLFIPGIPADPEHLFEYMDKMNQAGSMLVCDSAHIDRDLDDDNVAQFISRLDLFLCNEKEATVLTHRSTAERAAMILGSLCPEVVVKLGSYGALVLEGGLVLREKPIPIKILDTTGAGDGFNAGYIYGLIEGMLVERRLRFGNIVGGCITAGMGCKKAPSIEEVLELEEKYYRS